MADKKEPGPRNVEAMATAAERFASRPVRTYVKFEMGPDGKITAAAPHTDEIGHSAALLDAFGTTSSGFLSWSLGELEMATRRRGAERGDEDSSFNAALALVQAIAPQDELEAALASQMAGSHALTMEMLSRSKSTDSTEHLGMYANLAVKLQRTFTAQLEALGRLRGKGQQTVRVEHVTVQSGAQAIVGDVHNHPQPARGDVRGQSKSEAQPHETGQSTTSSEGCAALPSPNSAWNGVPIPSNEQREVPDPRRTVTRRAARKSKRA